MTPSRRQLGFVLAVALLGASACRSGAPRQTGAQPTAGTEFIQAYVGQPRILLHQGDERTVAARYGQPVPGTCDLAVVIRSAALAQGSARFTLEVLGLPKAERAPKCKPTPPAGIGLTLSGVPATASPDEIKAAIDGLLQTPEGYLKSQGITFDRPPGGDDKEVATQEASANSEERSLGRKVSEWPKRLLSVDAYSHDPTGRIRTGVELEFEAIVGSDGRIHRPRCLTGLSENDLGVFQRALSLWRFEPARGRDGAVGARMVYRLNFRVY
jgi:hypothetical protein